MIDFVCLVRVRFFKIALIHNRVAKGLQKYADKRSGDINYFVENGRVRAISKFSCRLVTLTIFFFYRENDVVCIDYSDMNVWDVAIDR
jgi:hypothetical protein